MGFVRLNGPADALPFVAASGDESLTEVREVERCVTQRGVCCRVVIDKCHQQAEAVSDRRDCPRPAVISS